jgi:type VI secretion system secreted protein Hcp
VAYAFYAQIKGQKSGQIKGSVLQQVHRDQIGGLAMSYEVDLGHDAATGLPTGKRLHKPFMITKEWDQSSPALLNVLFTNENLTTCIFEFWHAVANGSEMKFMTYTLTNANIISIHQYTASPDQLNQFDAKDLEDIAFTYQKIEVTWVQGGITAQDDWESRA